MAAVGGYSPEGIQRQRNRPNSSNFTHKRKRRNHATNSHLRLAPESHRFSTQHVHNSPRQWAGCRGGLVLPKPERRKQTEQQQDKHNPQKYRTLFVIRHRVTARSVAQKFRRIDALRKIERTDFPAEAKQSVFLSTWYPVLSYHLLCCWSTYRMWHLGHAAHFGRPAPATVQRIVSPFWKRMLFVPLDLCPSCALSSGHP